MYSYKFNSKRREGLKENIKVLTWSNKKLLKSTVCLYKKGVEFNQELIETNCIAPGLFISCEIVIQKNV